MTGSPANSAGPVRDPQGPLRGQGAGAGSAKAPLEHGEFEAMVRAGTAYCRRISPGWWRRHAWCLDFSIVQSEAHLNFIKVS